MTVTATVRHIFLRPSARTACQSVDRTFARVDSGLDGDHAGSGRREVTLLDLDAWRAACKELGADLPPSARRANLVVEGIDLENTRDRKLQIGEALIEILGETRPCELLNAIHDGLHQALRPDWRGGVHGRVLQEGEISVGALAKWIE